MRVRPIIMTVSAIIVGLLWWYRLRSDAKNCGTYDWRHGQRYHSDLNRYPGSFFNLKISSNKETHCLKDVVTLDLPTNVSNNLISRCFLISQDLCFLLCDRIKIGF